MIIDNTYFVNEIFIPHAKPSITDDITAIGNDITSFIEQYSSECLIKCLGYALYKEFISNLDSTKPNGLIDAADEKWDNLLNGTEYNLPNGDLVYWKGIRSKTGDVYNKSFLADYVYYHYEKSNDDDRVGVGNVKQKSENSEIVSKTPKVNFAWRRFFSAVQGEFNEPIMYLSENSCRDFYGVGIDWFQNNKEITLYKFIQDSNSILPDTYSKFNPFIFTNSNQFGL